MITEIEYALMAGASYFSTRADVNHFPVPAGWTESIDDRRRISSSGYEATYFTKGSEIVISFAGTDPADLSGDIATDLALAAGNLCDQLRQAADYYLQVKAENPDATITFTGHSLGGGLASLMAVFFDESAYTFDQAPFLRSALAYSTTDPITGDVTTRSVAQDLLSYLITKGADPDLLGKLQTYVAAAEPFNPNPISEDTLAVRALKVTNINTAGEFLTDWPVVPTSNRIGTQANIDNYHEGVSGIDLHSQALLTAFLQSDPDAATNTDEQTKSLSRVTFELPALLKMIFDKNLYAFDTSTPNTENENFLERLVKHQAGIDETLPADRMVERFTSDLWKLAQNEGMTVRDGLSSSNWVSRALIAFAMQKYYEETLGSAGYAKELFTELGAAAEGGGGIRFDMADVSVKFAEAFAAGKEINLSDAKGFEQYFKYYLDNNLDLHDVNFIAAETQLILSMLATLRDWYVQAGASGMNATDSMGRNALMLGGTGNDTLTGAAGRDVLIGGGGDDILQGGNGADVLLGGAGNDNYVSKSGDGSDLILDRDGNGTVTIDDQVMEGGAMYGDGRVYKGVDANGQQHTYVFVTGDGNTGGDLLIDNSILIKDYDPTHGNGFGFTFSSAIPDVTPETTSFTLPGDFIRREERKDASGSVVGETLMYANMVVYTDLSGTVVQNFYSKDTGGNDAITTGEFRDYINLSSNGGGADVIDSGGGQDYVNAGAGNDIIIGGEGGDILNGRSGDDRIYATAQITVEQAITEGSNDFISSAKGDWLAGGVGDDTLVCGATDDLLFGGGGQDLLIGGAGNDVMGGDHAFEGSYFNIDPVTTNDVFDGTSYDWTVVESEPYVRIVNGVAPGTSFTALDGGADVFFAGNGDDFLVGGVGNDILFGEAGGDVIWGDDNDPNVTGNDYLDGGAGNDVLFGDGGDDFLVGGRGDDTIYGGEGNDTYIYNAGDGVDVIHDDFATPGENTLRFGVGVDANSIKLRQGSLLLDLGNGDQIHIEGFNSQDVFGSASIGRFEFSDGSSLTLEKMLERGFDLDGTAGSDFIVGTNTMDRVHGFGGPDTLVGASGADSLYGGAGDDVIQGGEGNDLIDGGAGADHLSGGAGDDTYILSRGDGGLTADGLTEVIDDQEGSNTIRFGAGISVNDVQLIDYPGGLLHVVYGLNDSLLVMNGLSSDAHKVEFADGSSFTLRALYGRNSLDIINISTSEPGAELVGSAGGNTLSATGGGATFQGGWGDDTLVGSGGGNSYIYERGDGSDHIYDSGGQVLPDGSPAPNRIVFGNGISPEDVSLAVGADDTLEVLVNAGTAGRLVIHNFDANDAANTCSIEFFDFADGTSLSYAEMLGNGFQTEGGADGDYLRGSNLTDALSGGEGDDTLASAAGDDTLAGGAGNDLLQGGTGADTYLYAKGDGSDTLEEVDDGSVNVLRFAPGLTPKEVEFAADPHQNLLINVGNGDTLVLTNWLAPGSALVQRIEFDDGTVWTPELIRASLTVQSGTAGNDSLSSFAGEATTLYGLGGNDTLTGNSGNDQLVGGQGNDSLVGGLGDDGYRIELGDGQDILLDTGGTDAVLYGAGISPDDIQISRAGNDLMLSHVNASDKITIKGWFSYADGRNWVEQVRFADGSIWSAAEMTRQALTQLGTDAEEYLYGINNFGDNLFGGGGIDHLSGYSGDDYLDGGASYDYLYGGAGNDTLAAGPDGGRAEGGEGDDLYLYELGDGPLTIAESGGADTLRFGDGIGLEDVTFRRQDAWLYADIADGDLITIVNWFSYADGARQIERFEFADGTALTVEQLHETLLVQEGANEGGSLTGTVLNDTLVGAGGDDTLKGEDGNDVLRGGAGDDRLYGGNGNDDLTGGTGNDYLAGGNGNDSYRNLGEGGDRIVDSGGLDSAYFAAGITPEDLIISRDAADLRIGFVGRDDTVTLSEWFRAPGAFIEAFVFSDGAQWSAADINATFSIVSGDGSVTGTAGDELIYGGAGQDSLFGDAGDDLLDGAAGADTLAGGEGDDTYIADGSDTIVELPGEGIDTFVWTNSSIAALPAEVENLILTEISGNTAVGNLGDNLIVGNDQNNSLNGEAGADTLVGGLGSDTYYVDSPGDLVVEKADEGHDRVYSSISYVLPEHIEMLTLNSDLAIDGFGNDLNNALSGNDAENLLAGGGGNDTLTGNRGADTLIGGIGDDTYYLDGYDDTVTEEVDGGYDRIVIDKVSATEVSRWYRGTFAMPDYVEDILLTGYVSDATIYGNTLDNIIDARGAKVLVSQSGYHIDYTHAIIDLYGGAGNDTLYASDASVILDGGLGDDVMYGGRGSNTFYVDSENDLVIDTGSGGWDLVRSTVSYTLSALIEHLELMGFSNVHGTGNELNNMITGNSGDNLLTGGAGDDSLSGGSGFDTLIGGEGDDRLSGGNGFDTLIGGEGNDTYEVQALSNVLVEQPDEGIDTILSSISYTLASDFENLTLTGGTAIDGSGNESDNVIRGNDGNNRLEGGGGNDTLDGGSGNDTMLGGTGDDSYYVSSTKDRVIENADEGIDTVVSSISYSLGNHLENITLTGSAAINATGDALDNALTGNENTNTLTGAAGNDTLDGGGGDDKLIGGAGDDTYLFGLASGSDTIVENDATTGNKDVARFLEGISAEQLWFRTVGKGKNRGLEISILGTDDKLIIDKWYAGSQYRVEEFQTIDGGRALLESQVQNLVDAMSAFAVPPASTTLPPDQSYDAVRVAIAANWQ